MTAYFSTAYFPPIAYTASLIRHKTVAIEAKETFPKQTYRNRTEIATANGVMPLSIPVVRNNHSRTDEVKIDYSDRWNIIHLRTLEAAYSASPFFLYYTDDIHSLLLRRHTWLIDLNEDILHWMLSCLKINCIDTLTTTWMPPSNSPNDYRFAFSPKRRISPEAMPHLHQPYYQVFADRHPFLPNLSTLDLIFNMGPDTLSYLQAIEPLHPSQIAVPKG